MNRPPNNLFEKNSLANNPGKKGFTLLELIIVIVIIGVLATLGYNQYSLIVEKGRSSEAKALLSSMRTAEEAYNFENGTYASAVSQLSVSVPTSCDTNHFFSYNLCVANGGCYCGSEAQVYAIRCTSGGKSPQYTGPNYGNGSYTIRVCLPSGRFGNDAPFQ